MWEIRNFVGAKGLFMMNTEYINKLTNEYIDKHCKEQVLEDLIGECNREKEAVSGYHGREILELLQNADDAYQKSIDLGNKPVDDLCVEINYDGSILSVSNTGTFFDEDGIKAIVQGNNSSKTGKYIGNKGTGFRSLLNWANKIRILSGDYAIEFSKEYALEVFNSIKDKPQIAKQLKRKPDLYIPILSVPKNLDFKFDKSKTTIEIEVDPSKQNDDYSIDQQLLDIDMRILLFLPNLSAININNCGTVIRYEREVMENTNTVLGKEVIIRMIEDNELIDEESFNLFQKDITNAVNDSNEAKDIQLAIAVPKDPKIKIKYIYSYFPLLDTQSPVNCVIHATFSLGSGRNTLIRNNVNKKIVEKLIDFLTAIAYKFVLQEQYDIAYRILLPANLSSDYLFWSFPTGFAQFDLEKHYFQMVGQKRIFLTVNNNLISLNEKPKSIKGRFPEAFKDESFAQLLKSSNDSNRERLITLIGTRNGINTKFSEVELCQAINRCSDEWTIEQQIESFIWWNGFWNEKQPISSLPHLIKDQQGKWLKYGNECFFLEGDFNSIQLPEWVTIKTLREDYQIQLVSKAVSDVPKISRNIDTTGNVNKSNVIRLICQLKVFTSIDFKYTDRSNIVNAINSSIRNNYSHSIEFVKWLWHHYGQSDKTHTTQDSYEQYNGKLYFPSSHNWIVAPTRNLYFGEYYGNDLSPKLFSGEFHEFPDASLFSIEEQQIMQFRQFVSKLGIRNFPIIKTQSIQPIDSYSRLIKQDIQKIKNESDLPYMISCSLPYIENLVEVIEKRLSMVEVFKWILNDNELLNCLKQKYIPNNSGVIKYRCYRQKQDREFNTKVRNYILSVFNHSKWIEIDGERFAPSCVLTGIAKTNNQKFKKFIPVFTYQIAEDLSKKLGVKYDDLLEVTHLFDFAKSVTDLSSDSFYGLLLKLQESDNRNDIELSKIIYRKVESPDFKKEFEYSSNKAKFFEEGKLLVRYQHDLLYWPASDSFLPSTKIVNKKAHHIVEKSIRTNNSNFVQTFGCKEYRKEISIVANSIEFSTQNGDFQIYFDSFMKYARAYSERNENIESIRFKLSVSLVSKIDIIEEDDRASIIDNYMIIKDTNSQWYIVFNDNQKYDINKLSENIEDIFDNIANTPGFDSGKIGELFRAKTDNDRNFLIKKEFGSLDVLNDQNDNVIKRNFIETIIGINPSYNIDEIDIDFEEFKSPDSCSKIIRLFDKLNIDIQNFKEAGFVHQINLTDYWKAELEKYIRKEREHFTDAQYNKALISTDLQQSFLKTVSRFINSSSSINVVNSIRFSPEREVAKIFGDWRNVAIECSAASEYKKNYERMNPDNQFIDEIANNEDVQLMIYFNADKEFASWIDSQKPNVPNYVSTDIEDPYSIIRSTIPQKRELSYSPIDNKHKEHNSKVHKTNKVVTQLGKIKEDANRKLLGNKGELLIFNYLCDKYGKDAVKPHSEAFVDLGILKPGQAESCGYDLSYYDDCGNEFFVEVKTGERNRFFMSLDELSFAKEHSAQYQLFYVYDLDKTEPSFKPMPDRFWEDGERMQPIVEKFEFIL